MNVNTTIYDAVLFFLLSPGVLFRFPAKNHLLVLGIHAALFAIIWQLTCMMVYRQIYGKENFQNNTTTGLIIGICVVGGLFISIFVYLSYNNKVLP